MTVMESLHLLDKLDGNEMDWIKLMNSACALIILFLTAELSLLYKNVKHYSD